MERYDLIVVGGGTAGLAVATGSAALGARVALVERERLGGRRLWSGEVPAAALAACGRSAASARSAARFGVHAEPRVDFPEAMRWVRGARERIAPTVAPSRLRELGIEVIEGTARFTAPHLLDVDGRALAATRVVIATGSRPTLPSIPGLDSVASLTTDTVFDLTQRPGHLVILGASAESLALAQGFVRLGTRVTVIERGDALLPHEEVELAGLLGERLVADGITLELGATVTAARRSDFGVVLTRTLAGVTGDVGGTHLLVATGREPSVGTLDLEHGGVAQHEGGVQVDAHLRTTAPGTWACGGCTGARLGANGSGHEARVVVHNAFSRSPRTLDDAAIPSVTYTDPELARVGLTEREARARHGGGVRAFTRPFTEIDRAIADGQTAGGVKLVTSATGTLLGGHLLGAGAGEVIGELALAVARGLSIETIADLPHPRSSMADALRQAAQKYRASPRSGLAGWFVRR